MVFSSITFVLVFLPIVLLFYYLTAIICPNNIKFKCLNILLLISSMFFYAWGEPTYILLLISSMFVNFFLATAIEVNRGLKNSGVWLFIGVTLNLLFLIYFKYINFLISTKLFGMVITELPADLRPAPDFKVLLPLGISFYTFQAISYLIDVHRGTAKVARSLVDFGCYLTMFPQLVAGPIVRYESIAKELVSRELSFDHFAEGFKRFTFGLAKKMLIADTCGRIADAAFSMPFDEVTAPTAWIGMICYTLQIYFDFSGYSDMAIGLGKIFGFNFPENFNYPYTSKSISEFWRRWHMTLSGWFKDYLYIPMGGNRKGSFRTCLNLFTVFALCGFWHGADWMFLLWGAYYGFFLVLERVTNHFPERLFPSWLAHTYTIAVFCIGWLIFRSSRWVQFREFFLGLFDFSAMTPQTFKVFIPFFTYNTYITLAIGILLATPIYPKFKQLANSLLGQHQTILETFGYIWATLLFLVCLMPLYGATYNAFIYFRF